MPPCMHASAPAIKHMPGLTAMGAQAVAGAVLHAPLLDLMGVMSCHDGPLTQHEYPEWGDPRLPQEMTVLQLTCPLANLRPSRYEPQVEHGLLVLRWNHHKLDSERRWTCKMLLLVPERRVRLVCTESISTEVLDPVRDCLSHGWMSRNPCLP